MLALRKIVFYVFALAYLVICPLIVARILGFAFNPLTHHLESTGLVYVSTNPPQATVYIDGRLSNQKTPAVIRDLAPGNHFIRIEQDGYNDWERTVPIKGRKATLLADILLIPEQWPIKRISIHPYQNIYMAGDDVLIATNPLLKDIDIFHTTQGLEENFSEENTYEKTPLFSSDSVYADGQLLRIFNAPPSPFILLEANVTDKHRFLWVKVNENPPIIEDISDLFTQNPARVAWDNADNDNIFVFYPTSLYRINIKNKAIFPLDASRLPERLGQQPLSDIQNKFLINDKNDLLTRQGAWIRVYTKEDDGSPRIYDIAKSYPSTNMYFEEKNGELFYLDNDSRALTAAQILPYHSILNIPIPDALKNEISKKEPGI